jgi:Family of unknown function (DUF6062)
MPTCWRWTASTRTWSPRSLTVGAGSTRRVVLGRPLVRKPIDQQVVHVPSAGTDYGARRRRASSALPTHRRLAQRSASSPTIRYAQGQPPVTEPRDATAFEIRDALREDGCPVCRLALRAVDHYIAAIAYEGVNDRGFRDRLRAAGGFCPSHAYRWLRDSHSVLGTALIYRDLLSAARRDLEAERPSGSLLSRWRRSTTRAEDVLESSSTTDCPVCETQRAAEARYLDALRAILSEADGSAAFDRSDGLCVPHTRAALARGGSAATRVQAHALDALGRLLVVLDEVIRKEDYRFRHEPRSDAERAAPAVAVATAVSGEGLVRG